MSAKVSPVAAGAGEMIGKDGKAKNTTTSVSRPSVLFGMIGGGMRGPTEFFVLHIVSALVWSSL